MTAKFIPVCKNNKPSEESLLEAEIIKIKAGASQTTSIPHY